MQNLIANSAVDLNQNLISDCAYLGVLKVFGEDAETFLQGQLTQDITLLTAETSQLAALCTPKGRVLVIFRLFKIANDFFFILPQQRLAAIHKRLNMFVLMSKVKIVDLSEQLSCFGLATQNSNITMPDAADTVITHADLTFIRLANQQADLQPRCLVIGDTDKIISFQQKETTEMQQTSESLWRWLEIQSGLPQIFDVAAEAFVPQMLNLDTVNGLSFTKGCYTGQEVVSRMHYLGKAKRLLFKAHIDTLAEIKAGDTLYSATSKSAQGAGKVVDAQANPNGGIDCLVVAEIAQAEINNLQLIDDAGIHLTI